MRLSPITALAAIGLMLPGCGEYDPPPEVASTSMERGTYNPALGDIVLTFSEPVAKDSLKVRVVTAKLSPERDLCLPGEGDALPDGCSAEAAVVIDDDSDLITVSEDRTEARIDGSSLEGFTKYIVIVAGGLTDDEGRTREPDTLIPFFVQADVAGTPTDFESGLFFGRLTTTSPLPIKVTMFFWVQVDPVRGLVKLYGCDADPVGGGPDASEPSMQQDKWAADPHPPLGFTVLANGVIQEGEGDPVMELLPFDLEVTTPPVVAGGAVFRGSIFEGAPPGDVGGTRQLISGQLDAETVSLGGTLLEGTAQGDLVLFRLQEGEGPDLADLLAEGVTPEDVHSTFED